MEAGLKEPAVGRREILSNGSWSAAQQMFARLASAALAFLLILAVPVHEYGVYAYAIALCTAGMTLTTGGLDNLAVKALVNDPASARTLVATLLVIRESMALVAYVILAAISLTSGSDQAIAAVLLSALALFGKGLDVPEFWYRAKMRSRDPALVRILVTAVLLGVRLLVLWLVPNIWLMIALFVIESFVSTSVILVRYLLDGASPGVGKPSTATAKSMLSQSLPLFLSGIAAQVNLRADIVILQAMLGATAVGIYAAAARVSELAYFLPVVFMNATLPALLAVRKRHGRSSHEYRKMLQSSYDSSFWSGVGIALAAGISGTLLIHIAFSSAYDESIRVLWIHVMACPFVFMAAVYSKWLIAEGFLWLSLLRHGVGAVANVALNLALIPRIGIEGAAISTLASYTIASYLSCFIGKESRVAGIQMTLAFFAPIRWLRAFIRRATIDRPSIKKG